MLGEPDRYRIRVSGCVEASWAREVCGMRIVALRGESTELAGPVSDQSALLGVLRQLRDRQHAVLWLVGERTGDGSPTGGGSGWEDRPATAAEPPGDR